MSSASGFDSVSNTASNASLVSTTSTVLPVSSPILSLAQLLDLHLDAAKVVNYAAAQNSVPVVNGLTLTNRSDRELLGVELVLRSNPAFVEPCKWTFERLATGESRTLTVAQLKLALNHAYLFALNEAEAGQLEVVLTAQGFEPWVYHHPLRVLARCEWGATLGLPELLAAHVQPNTPEVDRLLGSAGQLLQSSNAGVTLNGYQSKNREHVWKQVNAIYQTLRLQGLQYAVPPASFEQSGQKIRTTEQILEAKRATCLDSSVLLAACFEQAGLNPVIFLKEGHAWVGVWLVDNCFALAVEDCAQDVRKRIASGELLVIESTLLTGFSGSSGSSGAMVEVMGVGRLSGESMHKAMAEATRYLEPDQEQTFAYAIDMKRARQNHIRAMRAAGSVNLNGGNSNESHADQMVALSCDLEPMPNLPPLDPSALALVASGEEGGKDETPEGRLLNWKAKLLDLSLRNRLLNFKPSKKFLRVVTHRVDELEDALSSGGEFRLVPAQSLSDQGDPRSEASFIEEFGLTSTQQHAQTALVNKEICLDVDKDKLQDLVTGLFRDAKNVLDETGSNSLYLALGILCWKETPEAETVLRAPILLVPVRLKRGAVGAGIRLERLDEEALFNPTLMQKLALAFDMALPYVDGHLPMDESGVDVAQVFATLRAKVAELKGFEVQEDCYLGLYSFAKYLMWRDLSKNAADLLKNKVVNHLVNHHGENFEDDSEAAVLPQHLDRDYKPQALYTPLLADSSQLAVICTAEKGKNMVVEGPPGTGKSQTITNLISHCLANGKTVLFVAEKMAALEVVHKRLTDIGLGEFLLELHSTKAKKGEVSKQLVSVLDNASTTVVADWEREAERLAALRNELNALVRVLHQRHRNGLSVYEAMGLTLKGDSITEFARFEWTNADAHSDQERSQLEDFVGNWAALSTRLSRIADHPLRAVKQTAWTPSWQDQWLNATKQCLAQGETLQSALANWLSLVGWAQVDVSCLNVEQLQAMEALAQTLLQAATVPLESMTQAFSAQDRQKLSDLIQHGQARASIWARLNGSLSGGSNEGRSEHLNEGLGEQIESALLYDADLKTLQASPLKLQWRAATQDWWPKALFSKRKVTSAIQLYHLQGTRLVDEEVEAFLELLAQLNAEDQYLQAHAAVGTACLGEMYQAENTNWTKAHAHWEWMEAVAKSVQQSLQSKVGVTVLVGGELSSPTLQSTLQQALQRVLVDQRDALVAGGSLFKASLALTQAHVAWMLGVQVLTSLNIALPTELGDVVGRDVGVLPRSQTLLMQWQAHVQDLQPWCVWNESRAKALSLGLQGLVEQVEQGVVALGDLKAHFVASYANWWLRRVLDQEPLLANFSGASHIHRIAQFQEVDARFQALTIQYVQAKLRGQIPIGAELLADFKTEAGFLRHEAQKQRMHRPIREVIQKAARVLPRVKPCLLMSPQSVAQYLDTHSQLFDVVIFDEASQIPTWDAVGAIARGKQLICVGDPKQLPPTNFFNASDAEGNFDDESLVEMESILDECLACGMPLSRLAWHYRSRNEGLITFSNHRYYESGLVTFPSPVEVDNSVEFVHSQGVYEPGKSRTNKIEAQRIVDEVERHYLSGEGARRSIGVITFNSAQQALIEQLLDARRLSNRELDEAIDQAPTEELFVKNLENVQGDERDVILFSITFAKDASGKLSMNFGPMNKEGGHRRLNVAVTRARHKVKVFSSLRPEDIDLSRTNARGVADLKAYLDFALNGSRALTAQAVPTGREPDSPFEVQVIAALRERGWRVVPQVGVSGYRIDLAVVNPHAPGKFLLGVECDGATYHSAPSARDRDRLRQLVLEGLGWTIHRIWSTDWWFNRELPLNALLKRLDELSAKAGELERLEVGE